MLIQDPWWRSRVLPLFEFTPETPHKNPIGLGTTFRVDPFGNAATAFHVIEHLLILKRGIIEPVASPTVIALDMPEGAIVLGSPPIPREWWRRLEGLVSYPVGIESSPLIHQPDTLRNICELCCLGLSPSKENQAPYLPVRFRASMPIVGDLLTAYGFANLDTGKEDGDPISQYLYAYSGKVTEVVLADPSSTRPWPKAIIETHWPSGMSGGPVINANGEVVGVVSTSSDGSEYSTAHIFAGWNVPEMIFPVIDPGNPGWFYGFAAVDGNGALRFFGHDPTQVKEFAASHECRALAVSLEHMTGNWVEANDPDGPFPPRALM